MLIILVYIVVFCIYFTVSLPVRLLIFAINFIAPDPIPVIDEVIMIAGIISKLLFLSKISDFVDEHREQVKAFGMVILLCIILVIILTFYKE